MSSTPSALNPSVCVPTASVVCRYDFNLALPSHTICAALLTAPDGVIRSQDHHLNGLHRHTFMLHIAGALTSLNFSRHMAPCTLTPHDMVGALRSIASDLTLLFQFLAMTSPDALAPSKDVSRIDRNALLDWLHAEAYAEFPSQALTLADSLRHTWGTLALMLHETSPGAFGPGGWVTKSAPDLKAVRDGILALPWRAPSELLYRT